MSEQGPNEPQPPPQPKKGSSDDALIFAARAQAEAAAKGSSHDDGADPGVDPALFPNYQVLREIHRGGQGVVFQAIQRATKRKVAIKMLREGTLGGSRGRARFEREVEILGQLDHPNIVSIIDSGVAEGHFYYVMDYVSGRTLDVWVRGAERPIDDILTLFIKICDAVNAAHLRGVIHRDLKPSNILIDANNEPHVVDFGLAKVATGEVDDSTHLQMMTMTGQFIGSLPWASPEQAAGAPDRIDMRTDVYSLGVILYQLLTGGKFPYAVIGAMRDVLDNILRAEPARPSTIRRAINNEVETIVLKCLSKERERRYQSAGDLGADLKRYLRGEPIEAKRDSGWYVVSKTLRRHRGPALACAAFVLLIVVFGAVMSVLYTRAAAAEREASERLIAEREAREAEQAQRERADRHFDAVRDLARTFMHDFHDEIAHLRGATRAREVLLREAVVYLERLAAESGDDAALRFDLADAHDYVGDLHGGLYMARLGDTDTGAMHYEQARRIREELLVAFPGDARAHEAMGRSLLRAGGIAQQRRRFDDAFDAYDRAVAAFTAAAGLAARDDADSIRRAENGRARAVSNGADVLVRMASEASDATRAADLLAHALERYDDAQSHWQRRLRDNSSDADAPRWLGMLSDKRAIGRLNQARLEAARARAASLAGDAQSASAALAAAHEKAEQAHTLALRAVDEFSRLSSERPESAWLRRDLWIAHHHAGDARMFTAGLHRDGPAVSGGPDATAESVRAHEEALRQFLAALDIAEALVRADEANLEARRDLVLCLNKAGNQLRDLGRFDEALAVFDRSLEVRRDVYATDPTQQHRRDLAVGWYKRGEILERIADRADAGARRALLDDARRAFAESLSHFDALRAEGVMAEDAVELRTVRNALAACVEKLGTAGE